MRPLDRLGSIKLKLGVLIVVAVAVTGLLVALGSRIGLPPLLTGLVTAGVALLIVQVLAHGMTSPLREMVAASRAMARGDYDRRVTATSSDEVGELARAFNSMATELAEVDRIRRDLVANASHELRTPIGALRAKLENVADGIEEPTPVLIEELLAQTQRLSELVEQLLDLSRLESGSLSLSREAIPAAEVVDRAGRDVADEAAARDVEIVRAVDPQGLVVEIDPLRFGQVLDNLVANAVRHSPDGRPVRVAAVGTELGTEFAVHDDGPGIPADEVERVFERFYRADRARATDGGGAGLGLAIARWIVELHGGTIAVDGSVASGCRMVVHLPR